MTEQKEEIHVKGGEEGASKEGAEAAKAAAPEEKKGGIGVISSVLLQHLIVTLTCNVRAQRFHP